MCKICHFDTRNFKNISLPWEGGYPLPPSLPPPPPASVASLPRFDPPPPVEKSWLRQWANAYILLICDHRDTEIYHCDDTVDISSPLVIHL